MLALEAGDEVDVSVLARYALAARAPRVRARGFRRGADHAFRRALRGAAARGREPRRAGVRRGTGSGAREDARDRARRRVALRRREARAGAPGREGQGGRRSPRRAAGPPRRRACPPGSGRRGAAAVARLRRRDPRGGAPASDRLGVAVLAKPGVGPGARRRAARRRVAAGDAPVGNARGRGDVHRPRWRVRCEGPPRSRAGGPAGGVRARAVGPRGLARCRCASRLAAGGRPADVAIAAALLASDGERVIHAGYAGRGRRRALRQWPTRMERVGAAAAALRHARLRRGGVQPARFRGSAPGVARRAAGGRTQPGIPRIVEQGLALTQAGGRVVAPRRGPCCCPRPVPVDTPNTPAMRTAFLGVGRPGSRTILSTRLACRSTRRGARSPASGIGAGTRSSPRASWCCRRCPIRPRRHGCASRFRASPPPDARP